MLKSKNEVIEILNGLDIDWYDFDLAMNVASGYVGSPKYDGKINRHLKTETVYEFTIKLDGKQIKS